MSDSRCASEDFQGLNRYIGTSHTYVPLLCLFRALMVDIFIIFRALFSGTKLITAISGQS